MGGDCFNSGSNNSGVNINNSTINKQSPVNKAAAKAYMTYNQRPQGLAGQQISQTYQKNLKSMLTIYKKGNLELKVSCDLSELIRCSLVNGKNKVYSYKRVIDPTRIQKIERPIYTWMEQTEDLRSDYFVFRQVNNEAGYYTAFIKIVKKTNTIVKQWATKRIEAAEKDDWIYYEKG